MVLAALPWAGGELGEGSPAEVARLMVAVEGYMVSVGVGGAGWWGVQGARKGGGSPDRGGGGVHGG